MTAILIGSVAMTPAFAQSDNSRGFAFAQPDFTFRIINIIEDIRLGFASGQDKVELIKEFAKDKQTRIDTALSRGETVSLAIEERRIELVDKALGTGYVLESNGQLPFYQEINQISEMNEIRILYSQFDECTVSCTESEKQEFNDKVNSLETWKNKCSGSFDIDNYDYSNGGFDKLSNSCPDLKQYDRNTLLSKILGD